MTKAVAEAAEAQYWDALADDEFERYERKQRFIDHFAAVLSEAGQWIGPIPGGLPGAFVVLTGQFFSAAVCCNARSSASTLLRSGP
jgi:hypothetical protein